LLVNHFLQVCRENIGKKVDGIESRALEAMMGHGWPGNVRELENTIERAVVLADGEKITLESLPPEIQTSQAPAPQVKVDDEEYSIKKMSKILETNLIRKALEKSKGNHTHAARLLEISHRALLYKIKEYAISEEKPCRS
jgi:two-component system response regulator AtoC